MDNHETSSQMEPNHASQNERHPGMGFQASSEPTIPSAHDYAHKGHDAAIDHDSVSSEYAARDTYHTTDKQLPTFSAFNMPPPSDLVQSHIPKPSETEAITSPLTATPSLLPLVEIPSSSVNASIPTPKPLSRPLSSHPAPTQPTSSFPVTPMWGSLSLLGGRIQQLASTTVNKITDNIHHAMRDDRQHHDELAFASPALIDIDSESEAASQYKLIKPESNHTSHNCTKALPDTLPPIEPHFQSGLGFTDPMPSITPPPIPPTSSTTSSASSTGPMIIGFGAMWSGINALSKSITSITAVTSSAVFQPKPTSESHITCSKTQSSQKQTPSVDMFDESRSPHLTPFERYFGMYGGPQLEEELEEIGNACARHCNRVRRKLGPEQRQQVEGMLLALGSVFGDACLTSVGTCCAADLPSSCLEAAAQLDHMYEPIMFLCEDSIAREAALGGEGGKCVDEMRDAAAKRLAEICAAQLQMLVRCCTSIAAPRGSPTHLSSDGVLWPTNMHHTARLLQNQCTCMVADLKLVADAYVGAITHMQKQAPKPMSMYTEGGQSMQENTGKKPESPGVHASVDDVDEDRVWGSAGEIEYAEPVADDEAAVEGRCHKNSGVNVGESNGENSRLSAGEAAVVDGFGAASRVDSATINSSGVLAGEVACIDPTCATQPCLDSSEQRVVMNSTNHARVEEDSLVIDAGRQFDDIACTQKLSCSQPYAALNDSCSTTTISNEIDAVDENANIMHAVTKTTGTKVEKMQSDVDFNSLQRELVSRLESLDPAGCVCRDSDAAVRKVHASFRGMVYVVLLAHVMANVAV